VKKVDLQKKVLVQKVEKAKTKLVAIKTKKVVVEHVAPKEVIVDKKVVVEKVTPKKVVVEKKIVIEKVAPKKEEKVVKKVVEHVAPKKEETIVTKVKKIVEHKKGKTTVEDCDEEKEVLIEKLQHEEKENRVLKLKLEEEETSTHKKSKIEIEKKLLQKELLEQQERNKELELKILEEEKEKKKLEYELKKEIHHHAKECACETSANKQKCEQDCKSRKDLLKKKVTTHHDTNSGSCVVKSSIACGAEDKECQKDFIVLCIQEETKKKNELLNIIDNCDSYLEDDYSIVYQQ